ncbi:MAG: Bax inhibitor-1/YccA family protein [Ignavibacteria bacterium]|nr:Bax inhibitor-1/YccA family protein [Ignavibacteria bacterium]
MEPIPVMQGQYSVAEETTRSFVLKVYIWMAFGLFLTAAVSAAPFLILGAERYAELVYEYITVIYILMLIELAIVFGLTFAINKIPSVFGFIAFIFYSALNGITLSPIFLVYTGVSIFSTFFVCAMMFAGTSLLGYITKMDLTRIGGFLTMALIGLIGAMVVNLFLRSDTMSWIVSFIGVIIFVGLTAYDTQRIKNMAAWIDSSSEEGKKASVMGALALYLDFINMFLFLLRLLGRRN